MLCLYPRNMKICRRFISWFNWNICLVCCAILWIILNFAGFYCARSYLICRYTVPEEWPYQEVRTLFKEPNVCTEIPDFFWTSPDKEVVLDISYHLVHVFSQADSSYFICSGPCEFLGNRKQFQSWSSRKGMDAYFISPINSYSLFLMQIIKWLISWYSLFVSLFIRR